MTCSLVLVDVTLDSRAIDNRYGLFVFGFCYALVATFDSFNHILDVGAQVGALAGVELAMFFRLTCPFARL